MKKALVAVVVLGGCGAVLGDGISYRNDFTTRTSSGTIPELGVWHEATPYPASGQIIDYNDPSKAAALARHAYGFELYGVHRYVFFHDYFLQSVNSGGDRSTHDGWFHPLWRSGTASSESGGYSALWQHRFGVNASVPENPCGWFYYDTATERQGYVLQSLHNNFTNGQLKIQVDIRAPYQWRKSNVRHFVVHPVYDRFMHAEAWNGALPTDSVTPGYFGIRCGATAGREHRTYPMYYDASKVSDGSSTQVGNNYSGKTTPDAAEKNLYWMRFEVTYDLDTARFSGGWKSLDTAWVGSGWNTAGHLNGFLNLPRPTFDTPTSTLRSKSFANALWVDCETNKSGQLTTDMSAHWAKNGSISGLGLFIGGLNSTSALNLQASKTSNTNNVLVDNIRVSWKAPTAADFAVCYENDFKTRRYRTLSAPSASTAATYAPKTESVSVKDVFTGYPDGALNTYNILPELGSEHVLAGEPGVDGWRRHYWGGGNSANGPVGVSSSANTAVGTGGKVMAFAWNASYTCLSQPIGTSFTSGKVTLQADLFLQGEWSEYTYVSDRNRAMLALGSAAMHTANTADFPSSAAASFGYRKKQSGTKDAYEYAWEPIAGPYGEATVLTGDAPAKNNWYRYRIVADLDRKTYDVTVWAMGPNSQPMGAEEPAEPFFAQTGLAFENDVTDIGSFAIYGYGYGNAIDKGALNRRVLVDNIIVKHDEDTLYVNDFDTRTLTLGEQPKATGYLAYEYNHADGMDGWIRQDGVGEGPACAAATVRDDNGNAFVSLGREQECGAITRYGHVLGGRTTKARFDFRVDIRPPARFARKSGVASVTLGGRSLEQLEIVDYDADKMLEFGFKGTNTAYAAGVAEMPQVFVGDQLVELTEPLDVSHWYRFRVKGNVTDNTCRMIVYDMGAAHPTATTPNGTVVASVRDLAPEKALSNGLSAFYLTASRVGHTSGETGVDPAQMLVDNIAFDESDVPGLVILIR